MYGVVARRPIAREGQTLAERYRSAVSDDQGRFRLTDVPDGEYRMRVWQEGPSELDRWLGVTGDSLFVDVAP